MLNNRNGDGCQMIYAVFLTFLLYPYSFSFGYENTFKNKIMKIDTKIGQTEISGDVTWMMVI